MVGCTTTHVAPTFDAPESRVATIASPSVPISLAVTVYENRFKEKSPQVRDFFKTQIQKSLEASGWSISNNAGSRLSVKVEHYTILYSGSFCTAWVLMHAELESSGTKLIKEIQQEEMWPLCFFGRGAEENSREALGDALKELNEWLGAGKK